LEGSPFQSELRSRTVRPRKPAIDLPENVDDVVALYGFKRTIQVHSLAAHERCQQALDLAFLCYFQHYRPESATRPEEWLIGK
jgi:hypothetical protein